MCVCLSDWDRFGLCPVVVNERSVSLYHACLCCPAHCLKELFHSMHTDVSTQMCIKILTTLDLHTRILLGSCDSALNIVSTRGNSILLNSCFQRL